MGRKPLNGVGRMTQEEKNARARELYRQPANREAARQRCRKYRATHKAERREYYRTHRDQELAQKKAWREANPDKVRGAYRRYISKNRAKVRAAQRQKMADPEFRAKRNEAARLRRLDPVVGNRQRWQKRLRYQATKNTPSGLRKRFIDDWRDRWSDLVERGDAAIERYHRRCSVRAWSYFLHWRRGGVEALENLWGGKI